MKKLLYLAIASFCLANIIYAADNRTCPTVPSNCRCSHRKSGFRISCSNLEAVSFESLPSDIVVDINLNNNNLKEINASTFPHPNNIRKLTIKSNKLSKIGDETFQGFNNLRKLDLSENNLIELKSATFLGLDNTSLSELDLSNNRILMISTNAFMRMKIDVLDLSNQMNLGNEPAELISYSDFLSRSLVKEIYLKNNYLMCDCNQKWLLKWLEDTSHKIDEWSFCFHPLPLRGTTILDLFSNHEWNCSKFDSAFSLPTFYLFPGHNQVLFENDQFEMFCYSTWVQHSSISWLHNGVKLSDKHPNVNITPSFNLTKGSYSSKLVITKLAVNSSGTITCQVKVWYSGTVSESREVRVIGSNNDVCEPTISRTDRGSIRWPTALDGAVVQSSCPHGSANNRYAYYTCSNGTWNSLRIKNCFFYNNFTRTMQGFYVAAKTHNPAKIKSMLLTKFIQIFPLQSDQIKTKYDLYFLSKMLEEIMETYKGTDGVAIYSKFLWNAIGMLVDHHSRFSTMKEVVYGFTSGKRFRSILEKFVFEQIQLRRYKTNLLLKTHHSMGATSVSRRNTNPVACYIIPSGGIYTNLETSCDTFRNETVYQMSSISLSVHFGKEVKLVRVTMFAYETAAFFQSENIEPISQLHTLSSIVGLKLNAKNQDGTETTTVSGVQFTFSNDHFKTEDPEFVYWKSPNGTDEDGEWVRMMWCRKVEEDKPLGHSYQKDVAQYRCPFLSTPNITYYALLGKAPVPIVIRVTYLETIVYFMAGLSCVFIIATLFIYGYFSYYRQLLYNRSDAATLMNLCLVLLITEIIFACGIHRTDDEYLCKSVAFALHYFLLCALVWLGCGGVVLLRLVKKKDRANVNEYDPVLKYYLVGWGIPLIICIISIAYDVDQYGTPYNCWLGKKTFIGGFLVAGGAILLADLAIFLYLHSVINRLFPEPLEGEPRVDSSDEDEDENCNREECHVNKCRYKILPKKYPAAEFRFPKRRELISYLYGSLLVLLLLCLTFTGISMIYEYQNRTAVYLYKFFSYGSAFCNLWIGVTIFYHHCIRRRDILKHLLLVIHNIRHKPDRYNVESEALVLLDRDRESREDEHLRVEKDSVHVNDVMDTHGVYGLSDHVVSDGSHVIATVRVETCKTYEGRGESVDDLDVEEPAAEELAVEEATGRSSAALSKSPSPPESPLPLETLQSPESRPPPETRAPMSQSEYSEQDRLSNTHDSIGECSLASSRPKRPPKNIQIPSNLKDFVPENWRPARRRTNKGASYYPYYISESNPISASLAYSSKSSSLASTTVSGVPLYLNNGRMTKHNNMPPHMNRLGPSPIRNHAPSACQSLPPMMFPNITPMRYTSPSYRGPVPRTVNPNLPSAMMQPVPREMSCTPQSGDSAAERSNAEGESERCFGAGRSQKSDKSMRSDRSIEAERSCEAERSFDSSNKDLKVDKVDLESLSESETEPPPKIVPPDLYIPIPHVSIKQFTLRSETRV